MISFESVRTVLFDLDGTLAPTEALKAKALSLAIRDLGGYAPAEIYKSVMGQSWEKVTSHFLSHAQLVVPVEKFNIFFREHYSQLIENELKLDISTFEFIQKLKQRNYTLGLVTSASAWMVQAVLKKLNLFHFFDEIVSGEETRNHKPHPEAYLTALRRLDAVAEETLVFEDSNSGFLAAGAAGVKFCGVRHEYNENHDFTSCETTLSSFAECADWFR